MPARSLRVALALPFLVVVALLSLSGVANAASCAVVGAKQWTGAAGDHSWFTAGNWAPAAVPTASDEVCINVPSVGEEIEITTGAVAEAKALESKEPIVIDGGSTLALASASVIDSELTLINGTRGGVGALTIKGSLHWAGSSSLNDLGTTTIASGASLLIDNAYDEGNRFLGNGHTLTVAAGAAATWSGGVDIVMSFSTLSIAGSFDIQTDQNIVDIGGSPVVKVTAGGTLTKSAGVQTTIDTLFQNSGTVAVNAGVLRLTGGSGGFTSGGTWSTASGAETLIESNTHKLVSPAKFVGAGKAHVTEFGRLEVNGPTTVDVGATIEFGGSGAGGSREGTSTLTVKGTMIMSGGGRLDGPGTTTIAAGGQLEIGAGGGGVYLDSGAKLTIAAGATGTWGEATEEIFMQDDSVLTVAGTLSIGTRRGIDRASPGSGTDPPIVKVPAGGVLKKTAGLPTPINVAVDNDGTVRSDAGVLALLGGSGPGSSSGNWATSSGAEISLEGMTHAFSYLPHITGGGVTRFEGDVNVLTATTLTVDAGATAALTSGQLRGPGAVSVNGTLAWDGQSLMTDAGTTTIASGATLLINNDADFGGGHVLGGARKLTLVAGSTGTWSGLDPLSVNDTARFDIAGTFNAKGNNPIFTNANGLIRVITTGTFNKQTGSGATQVYVPLENDGTVKATSGRIQLLGGSGAGAHSGSWATQVASARVILEGPVDNVSAIAHVTGPGRLVLNGDINQTGTATVDAGGTLEVLGGVLRGAGATNVAGTLRWDGTSTMTSAGTAAATMTVTGNLIVDGAGQRTLAGGRKLNANGTGTWAGASQILVGDASAFTVNGAMSISNNQSLVSTGAGSPTFKVGAAGVLQKTTSGETVIGVPFTNSGTTIVDRGMLSLDAGTTNYTVATGLLSGGTWTATAGGRFRIPSLDIKTKAATVKLFGTTSKLIDAVGNDGLRNLLSNTKPLELRQGRDLVVSGVLNNSSTIALDPDSTLGVTGKYTQTAAGTLAVAVNGPGTVAGVNFGKLTAGNGAALAGTLAVTTLTAPPSASTLVIIGLTGGVRTGTFTTTTGTTDYDVLYNPTDVTLERH